MILRDFTLSLSSSRKVSSTRNIKIRFSLAMKLDGTPLQLGTRTGTLHQRHLIWLSHHLCVWICNSICICICFCAHLISLESLRQRHQPIHRPSQFLTENFIIRSAQISSRWRKIQLNEQTQREMGRTRLWGLQSFTGRCSHSGISRSPGQQVRLDL